MKPMFWIGAVLIVLGVLSFFVPVPHTERHGISAGDLSVGIKTKHSETVSPVVSCVLILAGAGMLIVGRGSSKA
jgi:hypothetical protein